MSTLLPPYDFSKCICFPIEETLIITFTIILRIFRVNTEKTERKCVAGKFIILPVRMGKR